MKYYDIEIALKNKGNATELTIFGLRKKAIPPEITQLKKLTKITISINLPDSFHFITQLKTLQIVHFFKVELKDIPEEILKIKNLKELGLIDIPSINLDKLNYLKSLKTIHLVNTQLEFFPDQLLKIPNLENIFLYDNKISTLPDEIKSLKSLNY